nr:hypothetical protein [Tanacetum cinerariifolium]GFA81105.1 hypothetical protein [Tanacetum cinerariifolium]
MLDETQYSSWASRMLLYTKGKEHGKLLYDSVINRPFKYGTVTKFRTQTTPAIVRDRTYDELTNAKKIHAVCNIKETYIVLQGLLKDRYNLVNHHKEAKDIWDRVKLLIEGPEISLQERESKLYDMFDTFTSVSGETIHSYYLRISLDEEQMVFLAYNGDTVTIGQESQEIPTPAIFQTDDLDAFHSDCDEAPSASVVLMAKLSAYDLDVHSEVQTHDNYLDNHVIDQIIQDASFSTQQDELIMYVIEEMSNQVAKCNEVDK